MRSFIVFIAIIIAAGYEFGKEYRKQKSEKDISVFHPKAKPAVDWNRHSRPPMKREWIKAPKASSANGMEDRQNDWLAKQIREERQLLEKGDLLDLGARHGFSCAAREIREEHRKKHDDSIDTGEVFN